MIKELPEIFEIKMMHSRIFIVVEERVIIIDTGLPGSLKLIRETLKEKKIEPERVSLIILTHCHSDHFGDISGIKEYTGAKVAVHRTEADCIREGKNTEIRPVSLIPKLLSLFFRPKPIKGVEPDILIDNELPLDDFGVNGKIIHTPGHTPGSISVLLKDGKVFIGDLLMKFNEKNKPVLPIFATDMNEAKRSIEKLLSMSPKIFYLAHGGACDPDEIKKAIKC